MSKAPMKVAVTGAAGQVRTRFHHALHRMLAPGLRNALGT